MKKRFLHIFMLLALACVFVCSACNDFMNDSYHKITVETTKNGLVEASKTKALAGDEITITVTPAPKYELDYITLNGEKLDELTFEMPNEDVAIFASFKKLTYAITVEEAEHGTISVEQQVAAEGDLVEVMVVAEEKYELDYITVNGEKVDGATFEMPGEAVTLAAKFKEKLYTVSIVNVLNGTVVADKDLVKEGEVVTLTVTPDTEYELESIKVNGEAIEGTTFEMSASNVEVVVTFKKITYTITALETENGAIELVSSASKGELVSITVIADDKYELDYITVNDEIIEGTTFEMPGEAVVINAVFARITYAINIANITGGTVTVDKNPAAEGELVTITALADENYVLLAGKITVDEQVIEGTTFEMPAHEVSIEVEFTKAEQFGDSALYVSVGNATSKYYALYDTAGIYITVKVRDPYVSYGGSDLGYDDNVEFSFGLKSEAEGLDVNYTYNFLATAGGKFWFRKANSVNTFGPLSDPALNIAPGSNFWYSVEEVYFTDGSSGYCVYAYFGYDLLNTTPEEAIGNITIAPYLRDTDATTTSFSCISSFGENWGAANHFVLITEDGNFVAR